ncbi:hypothetical protein HaLaN_29837 [Haematococcus lacustris]|uniref:Uncharacterized protein n=1 Tax=Haematococcus lacustris TaxID=44745 RepID=A0A6A0AEZ3_HAELA|nr:hypothetical protein HaLaN_29837 [Haematococcus lacustris]
MYPIFRKPRSGRLPTTAEHPSLNNHIASQRSVTASADDEGVEVSNRSMSVNAACQQRDAVGPTGEYAVIE